MSTYDVLEFNASLVFVPELDEWNLKQVCWKGDVEVDRKVWCGKDDAVLWNMARARQLSLAAMFEGIKVRKKRKRRRRKQNQLELPF